MIKNIAVIGLGYVGLPLSIHLGKEFNVIGIDVNKKRISDLKKYTDTNNEISKNDIEKSNIEFTSDFSILNNINFIIVSVPTPIDKNKKPDLANLKSACEMIGQNISKNTIIVFESTVYPGLTEEYCIPIIEENSKFKFGKDFNIGYSPERINPGDKLHTIDSVIKIISANNKETLDIIEYVYSKIVKVGLFKTSSIKVAEMAKVIENTQRDINIALMNEIAIICNKINISTKEVLDAAGTKWNFLKFFPGLVGGHCIGVDPYYLTYKCEELNYHPQIILAGRRINDSMGKYIAEKTVKKLIDEGFSVKNSNVLIMGVTFKENIKDIRNSKVLDIVNELKDFHINVFLNDPYADSKSVEKEFGLNLSDINKLKNISCIIFSVMHDEYKNLDISEFKNICVENPIFIDVKSYFKRNEIENKGFIYWSL